MDIDEESKEEVTPRGRMNPHRTSALTLTEVLVCLAIVGVLAFLATFTELETHQA